MQYYVEIKEPCAYHKVQENCAHVIGVEFGNGSKPITLHDMWPNALKNWENTADIEAHNARGFGHPLMIFHHPGGTHWVSRGDPHAYHGASFHITELVAIEQHDDKKRYKVNQITDFEIRKKK